MLQPPCTFWICASAVMWGTNQQVQQELQACLCRYIRGVGAQRAGGVGGGRGFSVGSFHEGLVTRVLMESRHM
jgi:hypothetical protein